jgi:hypothetical protein
LTGTINVSLTYLEPEEIIASLNESNAYTSIVKENQITTDKTYNLVVSADIGDNKASFDVVEVSELYKYSFYGTNNDGETIEAGYVVPVQYNKTLKESKAADQISVNIENAINIDAFKKTYVLNKVDDSIWTCEDVSDENTLNIKFNGEEVRLKITSINGNVIAYIFAINVNDAVIFNTNNCHNHVYASNKTELKYSEMEASGGEKYYPININPISINDDIA